jgi:hypothetical protein
MLPFALRPIPPPLAFELSLLFCVYDGVIAPAENTDSASAAASPATP